MLNLPHTPRAFTCKVALGIVALMLVLVACNVAPTTSSTPTNTPTKPGCSVTAADLAIPGGGSARASSTNGIAGMLMIDGSAVIAPFFSDAARTFQDANRGVTVIVTPNYSEIGLNDVEIGRAQIGMSDVFAIEKEPGDNPKAYDDLVDHRVAVAAFTLIVSSDIAGKITDLSIEQIQGIYTGQYTNWSQLSGPHEAITVIDRNASLPASFGARVTFKRYVMGGTAESVTGMLVKDTNADVAAAVNSTPGAIAYVATNFVVKNHALAPICIDGYGATMANIRTGKYRFWSYEHAYTNGQATGVTAAFLKFISSHDFQTKNLPARGFLPVSILSQAARDTHPFPAAP